MYQQGIVINNPNPIRFMPCEFPEPTWAERERDRLVYKLKRKQIMANNILLFFINTVVFIIILVLVAIGVVETSRALEANEFLSFIIGVDGALLTILFCLIANVFIDGWFRITHAKHKNKIYHL